MQVTRECCNKDCNNTFSFPKRIRPFDSDVDGYHIYSYKICGGNDGVYVKGVKRMDTQSIAEPVMVKFT